MTRVKESLAAQERMNKENNVSPERLEMLKNLFSSPVISTPISIKRAVDQKKDAEAKQDQR